MADADEEILLADDILPNESGSSNFFIPERPEELERTADQEKAKVQSVKKEFLDDILGWIDDEIAAASHVFTVKLESKVPVERQILGLQDSAARLTRLRDKLHRKMEQYITKAK